MGAMAGKSAANADGGASRVGADAIDCCQMDQVFVVRDIGFVGQEMASTVRTCCSNPEDFPK